MLLLLGVRVAAALVDLCMATTLSQTVVPCQLGSAQRTHADQSVLPVKAALAPAAPTKDCLKVGPGQLTQMQAFAAVLEPPVACQLGA